VKRKLVVGMVTCLFILSGCLAIVMKAQAHQVASSLVSSRVPPMLSDQQVKDYARKTLGASAVDRMLHRVTHPLKTQRFSNYTTSFRVNTITQQTQMAARVTGLVTAASGHEAYNISNYAAGYAALLGQQAFGVEGQFNAEPIASPASVAPLVYVGLGYYSSGNQVYFPITAGIDPLAMVAAYHVGSSYVSVLRVNAQDQISSEIYQWDGNGWFIFIFDHTTGEYFSQIVDYDPGATLNQAAWVLTLNVSGPLGNFLPITFTNANWQGANSGGWQPLINAGSYAQLFLQPKNGVGRAWTTEIPDPPGNSFSMLYCPSCSG